MPSGSSTNAVRKVPSLVFAPVCGGAANFTPLLLSSSQFYRFGRLEGLILKTESNPFQSLFGFLELHPDGVLPLFWGTHEFAEKLVDSVE